MTSKETDAAKAQAAKLERYINQYPTRAVNLHTALKPKGTKMLNDLLQKVSEL